MTLSLPTRPAARKPLSSGDNCSANLPLKQERLLPPVRDGVFSSDSLLLWGSSSAAAGITFIISQGPQLLLPGIQPATLLPLRPGIAPIFQPLRVSPLPGRIT